MVSEGTDMGLLLMNLDKAGVLLAVTAMLFALKSWLVWYEEQRKIRFTWDSIKGKLLM